MINIYVIGCGGIGGYLLELLPMSIASLNIDMSGRAEQLLIADGMAPAPSVVDRLTLIDGDVFDQRNAIRQASGNSTGSKVAGRLEQFLAYAQLEGRNKGLLSTWLSAMEVAGVGKYVTPDTISQIIPREPKKNMVNANLLASEGGSLLLNNICKRGLQDAAVVFLCVDNDKTRLEVAKYMETFDTCLLVSGGNTKTTGNVLVYERSLGEELDPPIYEMFDNIAHPKDKRPDERSCTDVAPKHDQVANTNCMIATWMSVVFSRWVREGLDDKDGRINEVLIDTDNYAVDGVRHLR